VGVVQGVCADSEMQTRQKLKEAYQAEFIATIERADKQIILARHGLRLLQLLDDTPVVPGDTLPRYENASQARQILNDAEDDLKDWQLPEGLLTMEGGVDGGDFTNTRDSADTKRHQGENQMSPDNRSLAVGTGNGGEVGVEGRTPQIGA